MAYRAVRFGGMGVPIAPGGEPAQRAYLHLFAARGRVALEGIGDPEARW
jgi:hypothetical protein